MHIGVTPPVLRQPVNVRHINRRAVTADLPEAGVVERDEERIRRAFFRAQRFGPGRTGFADGASEATGECGSGLYSTIALFVPLPFFVALATQSSFSNAHNRKIMNKGAESLYEGVLDDYC
jgi:hypothetical protein